MEENRRQCGVCGVWMSRAIYARYVRYCGVSEGEATVSGEGMWERTMETGGRKPDVWKNAALHQHGEAP